MVSDWHLSLIIKAPPDEAAAVILAFRCDCCCDGAAASLPGSWQPGTLVQVLHGKASELTRTRKPPQNPSRSSSFVNSKPVQVTRLTARPFLWSSSPPAGMMIVRDVKVDIRLSKDIEVGLDLSNTNSARAIHTYCKLPLTFKIKMSDFESQRRYIYVYLCFIKVPVCLGTHPPPAWCF